MSRPSAVGIRAPLLFTCILLALVTRTSAYTFELLPGNTQCFYEYGSGHADQTPEISTRYVIHDASARELVNFTVTEPKGTVLFTSRQKLRDAFVFRAEEAGEYRMCFFVEPGAVRDEPVRLSLTSSSSAHARVTSADATPLERLVMKISDDLGTVQSDQRFMRKRDGRMLRVIRSTARKITGWFVLKLVVLVAAATWQLLFVKKYFGYVEVKE